MRNLLFGLLLLFLSPLLRAQTPAVITFDQGQITVLRDTTKQLTLDQARSAHAEGQFRQLKGNLGLGYIPDAVWLHLSVNQHLPSARWLEVIPPYLDDIRLFHIGPDGRIDERRSGDRLPQSAKEEPYRGHVFKIDLQPGHHDIFIRLQTTSTVTAIVKLWQPRAFEQHLRSSYLGFGLYFSLILTVLLFNTANWLVSRHSIFLVYVGYLLVNCLQWMGTSGIVSEFLLPVHPGLANLGQGLLIPAGRGADGRRGRHRRVLPSYPPSTRAHARRRHGRRSARGRARAGGARPGLGAVVPRPHARPAGGVVLPGAINLARSQFRRRAAARRAHERMPAPPTTVDGQESSDDELMRALRHLPEQQRAVVALRFLADLSVESTAEVLGIPTGTVKSTTNRALAALRTHLEPRAADVEGNRGGAGSLRRHVCFGA